MIEKGNDRDIEKGLELGDRVLVKIEISKKGKNWVIEYR